MTDIQQTVRAHVFVNGRVQGVGFRAFVCRKAEQHGLSGWVRNVVDGRVETEAQGPRALIDKFLQDLERGPTFSNVTSVEVDWITLGEEDNGFEVKY